MASLSQLQELSQNLLKPHIGEDRLHAIVNALQTLTQHALLTAEPDPEPVPEEPPPEEPPPTEAPPETYLPPAEEAPTEEASSSRRRR